MKCPAGRGWGRSGRSGGRGPSAPLGRGASRQGSHCRLAARPKSTEGPRGSYLERNVSPRRASRQVLTPLGQRSVPPAARGWPRRRGGRRPSASPKQCSRLSSTLYCNSLWPLVSILARNLISFPVIFCFIAYVTRFTYNPASHCPTLCTANRDLSLPWGGGSFHVAGRIIAPAGTTDATPRISKQILEGLDAGQRLRNVGSLKEPAGNTEGARRVQPQGRWRAAGSCERAGHRAERAGTRKGRPASSLYLPICLHGEPVIGASQPENRTAG